MSQYDLTAQIDQWIPQAVNEPEVERNVDHTLWQISDAVSRMVYRFPSEEAIHFATYLADILRNIFKQIQNLMDRDHPSVYPQFIYDLLAGAGGASGFNEFAYEVGGFGMPCTSDEACARVNEFLGDVRGVFYVHPGLVFSRLATLVHGFTLAIFRPSTEIRRYSHYAWIQKLCPDRRWYDYCVRLRLEQWEHGMEEWRASEKIFNPEWHPEADANLYREARSHLDRERFKTTTVDIKTAMPPFSTSAPHHPRMVIPIDIDSPSDQSGNEYGPEVSYFDPTNPKPSRRKGRYRMHEDAAFLDHGWAGLSETETVPLRMSLSGTSARMMSVILMILGPNVRENIAGRSVARTEWGNQIAKFVALFTVPRMQRARWHTIAESTAGIIRMIKIMDKADCCDPKIPDPAENFLIGLGLLRDLVDNTKIKFQFDTCSSDPELRNEAAFSRQDIVQGAIDFARSICGSIH